METKEVFLEGYFHFQCYMEDNKIREEVTKASDTMEEITCVVFAWRGYTDEVPRQIKWAARQFLCFISEHHYRPQYQVPHPEPGL